MTLDLSDCILLQFVQWAIPGETNPDTFFTDDRVKTLYKNHIRDFLNHVNTKTGLAYKDDPVIFGFGEQPNTVSDLGVHHPCHRGENVRCNIQAWTHICLYIHAVFHPYNPQAWTRMYAFNKVAHVSKVLKPFHATFFDIDFAILTLFCKL